MVPHVVRSFLVALLLAAPAAGAAGGKSTGSGFQELQRHLKESFQRSHPCPSTGRTTGNCPGWFVGYVRLPRLGGTYDPSNLRWMTDAEAEQTGQDRRW
jgi:hypothetical protein